MADSPTQRLARSLGIDTRQDSTPSPVCDICGGAEGPLELWPHQTTAHWGCVPATWRRERDAMRAFAAGVGSWAETGHG